MRMMYYDVCCIMMKMTMGTLLVVVVKVVLARMAAEAMVNGAVSDVYIAYSYNR